MPENIKNTEDLIDVGETVGADINLDDKGEPETIEAPVEEKIEVEQAPAEDKTFCRDSSLPNGIAHAQSLSQ